MSQDKNYHVVPHNGSWAARRENSDRVSSQHDTQREAIEAARQLAQNTQGEVRIHNRQGQIRDSDSYGKDPNPPRDRKH